MTTTPLSKFGEYDFETGWAIYTQCEKDIIRLQMRYLFTALRAGDRPVECIPAPPAGRTLVEFAAAAWTSFHGRFYRRFHGADHHREPDWLAFAKELEAVYHAGRRDSIDTLADRALTLLPDIDAHLERERAKWEQPVLFGAFLYHGESDAGYVALHFHNCYMPDSPFSDPTRVYRSLLKIIDDIDRRGLDVERIGMDSWINNIEPVKDCFPKSYADSSIPTSPDAKGGNGWWGQFILRTGRFNEKRAAELLATRTFKYPRTHCECPYSEFVDYIRSKPV